MPNVPTPPPTAEYRGDLPAALELTNASAAAYDVGEDMVLFTSRCVCSINFVHDFSPDLGCFPFNHVCLRPQTVRGQRVLHWLRSHTNNIAMPADSENQVEPSTDAVARFQLIDPPTGFVDDPYPWYEQLRHQSPVHRLSERSFFLSRYDDVIAAYRDPRTSSDKHAEFTPKFGDSPLLEHHTTSLVFNDPPLIPAYDGYHGRIESKSH
ncbi:MAG: hypothetical protein Ct9H300mP14_06190 [Gammaproteobacteria bacterium]|nr:MAG: hypothetical protein Ct9H300mP14_06190 [Gammaproteobacteria bacterium]